MITCPRCGYQAPDGTPYCPRCGYDRAGSVKQESPHIAGFSKKIEILKLV